MIFLSFLLSEIKSSIKKLAIIFFHYKFDRLHDLVTSTSTNLIDIFPEAHQI